MTDHVTTLSTSPNSFYLNSLFHPTHSCRSIWWLWDSFFVLSYPFLPFSFFSFHLFVFLFGKWSWIPSHRWIFSSSTACWHAWCCCSHQRGCGKIGLLLRLLFPPLDATCPVRALREWRANGRTLSPWTSVQPHVIVMQSHGLRCWTQDELCANLEHESSG